MRALLLTGLAALLPLAACDRSGGGTSVSIKGGDGNVLAEADGDSGQVKLDLPGFQGKFDLPRVKVAADNFDLNGVRLYPGSSIDGIDVNGGTGGGGGGGVRVSFTSPASPATVRDWLMTRLNKADFAVTADGNGLIGTTDDRKPFRLEMAPAGANQAKGHLTIGG